MEIANNDIEHTPLNKIESEIERLMALSREGKLTAGLARRLADLKIARDRINRAVRL